MNRKLLTPPPMLSPSSVLTFFAACLLTLLIYVPEPMLEGMAWQLIAVIDVLLIRQLLKIHRHNGAVLIVLILLFTYYLAPVPYLAFDIPIVPYHENVSVAKFTRTWTMMSAFLAWLTCFSAATAGGKPLPRLRFEPLDLGAFGYVYWLVVLGLILGTFRGQSVVNVAGDDNYDVYIANLQSQSGALEYFLILIAVGHAVVRRPIERACYYSCIAYYIFFCFTRGYRVQMLEMVFLAAILHLGHRLTLRNVLVASVIGFFALQLHGVMKHGAADLDSVFIIMAGEEVRSNQTEVFYTTNNVLHPVLESSIPWSERISSLSLAVLASVLPGSALPPTWHSTLSAQSVTQLPGGGGGFISGHYYYWGASLGLLIAGGLVTFLFRSHERATSRRTFLLTALLLATSPRWIAYEPIANFFRIGVFFFLVYETVTYFSRGRRRESGTALRLMLRR